MNEDQIFGLVFGGLGVLYGLVWLYIIWTFERQDAEDRECTFPDDYA